MRNAAPAGKADGMEVETSSASRKTAIVYNRNGATIRAILLVGAVFMLASALMYVLTALFLDARGIPGFSLTYLFVGGFRAALGAVVRASLFVLIFWFAKDFFLERWVLYATVWWFVSILGVSCMAITETSGLVASALRTFLSLGIYLFSAYLTKEIYSRTVDVGTSRKSDIGRSISSAENRSSVEDNAENLKRKGSKNWNRFTVLLGLEVAVVFFSLTLMQREYEAPPVYQAPNRDHLWILVAVAIIFIAFPVFNNVRSNTVRDNDSERFNFNRSVSATLLYLMAFVTNFWLLIFLSDSQGGIGTVFGPLFLVGFVVIGILGLLNFFSLVFNFPRRT